MSEDVEQLKSDVKHDINVIRNILIKHDLEIRNLKLAIEVVKPKDVGVVGEIDIYG